MAGSGRGPFGHLPVSRVLDLARIRRMTEAEKDIEILELREVLHRQVGRRERRWGRRDDRLGRNWAIGAIGVSPSVGG